MFLSDDSFTQRTSARRGVNGMRARSPQGQVFSQRLNDGGLQFQHCKECRAIQYPPAEICRRCLSDELDWQSGAPSATVIACVAVHRSYAADFADGGPWWVASVSLDDGVVCYTHALDYLPAGSSVHLVAIEDRLGDGVLGCVVSLDEQSALQAKFR